MGFKSEWKERKINEIVNSSALNEDIVDEDYLQEKYYLKAKKKAEEIKGFYVHLIVTIFSFPIILFVNLKFVPGFHFFWFALGGMIIGLFFHWLGVFGFEFLGLGKKWEERKTAEILKKYK
ncbi:histidine kinase [Polaribacter aquimarinus]|uniref:Histidine kinase n=2 Tax=Polaribacter aquimarinus TaxID=2100726 RepID=A0A2U2J9K5_9FLAO|nr:histidine kinase [Polaribacter aquimarinus]